jgi:pyruvate,water dikinase
MRRPAPEVLGSDGRPPVRGPVGQAAGVATGAGAIGAAAGAEETLTLSGIAASAGQATGVAQVVATPAEAAQIARGDVLVTRATDPGWTPVFPLAGAIVLEVGGQLSHGAIVAREYGIPAVVNVSGATRRIPSGRLATVDGSEGRVTVLAG